MIKFLYDYVKSSQVKSIFISLTRNIIFIIVRIIYAIIFIQNHGYNTYCRIEKKQNDLQLLCENKKRRIIE